jgi:TolB-like protein/tetratricopeptide (TPR) repeat protein
MWLAWPEREAPAPPATEPPSPSKVRIAVLPLANLTPNEENRYFADGVTEDILTHLSRVPDLFVVSSASVLPDTGRLRPIAEIAAMLGVDYILRGSVRRDGERVRITAQLVDAKQNAHVWGQTYDERLEDIFAVQSEIATRVATALNAEIVSGVRERIARAPTEDLVAYNLYLRGRYFWHRRTQASLIESVRSFEEAVARDSSFARAWAGVADAYAVLAFYDYLPPAMAYPKAKAAARRAPELDPFLAEAHASLGYIALYYDWDSDAAEAAFERSIELNPSYTVAHQWYANHLVARGRFDEAAREMTHARELNPLSLIANGALGWVYFFARRYEDAIAQCNLALEMAPDWDLCRIWQGQAHEELGRRDEAIASLQRAVELSGGSGISVAALARAYATFGEPERARQLLAGILATGKYQPSYEIAKVYIALGEHDRAIDWLERAYQEHAHSMAFLKVDPQLVPLHGHPRFERRANKVGV